MTLKKLIYLALFICISIKMQSQQIPFSKPDYDLIKKNIANKSSSFYYQKLQQRLAALDTLLTKDEYRHLYFGYAFQKKYNANWISPVQKELEVFYKQPKIDAQDHDKIIKLLDKSIIDFPFDLQSYNFLYYIVAQSGDNDEAMKISKITQGLFSAILSSGDGKTCETGFHVLVVAHEYALLNMFELRATAQSLVGNCDYLSFEKGKYKIEGLFFDIRKMRENQKFNLEKKFK
ncbi:MAG: hypothetical protein RLZZ312_1978 [Bacteroidota bacterium]|jgi:hypothetical protein